MGSQRVASLKASLGIINVILAALGRIGSHPSRVMFVTRPPTKDSNFELKRARVKIRPALSFLDEDKVGTIQPHDDALVVTLRIGWYDVKRVLVDQGSRAEIMYPNLYKGLNLKPEDLTSYDSPHLGFDGKVVKLPIQAGSEVVEMDFIVGDESHGLHGFEQGLSKGPFPHVSDRPASGCNYRSSSDEFFGCLLLIPLNTANFG